MAREDAQRGKESEGEGEGSGRVAGDGGYG